MESTKGKNTKKTWLAALCLALAALTFFFLYRQFLPKAVLGAKEVTVTITHGDETVRMLTLNTDEEYLGAALAEYEDGLILGEDGPYGLYVMTVDGETADESQQQWWCFTKGGETVNTGVDETPVADGEAFEITLTTGW